MKSIGVFGGIPEDVQATAGLLFLAIENTGCPVKLIDDVNLLSKFDDISSGSFNDTNQNSFIIIPLYKENDHINFEIDILVCLDSTQTNFFTLLTKHMKPNCYILFNADDKPLFPVGNILQSRFITFGYNKKACITISSILDSELITVQICIQRNFQSIVGTPIIEQEFSISLPNKGYPVNCILGATGAALIAGISVSDLFGIKV